MLFNQHIQDTLSHTTSNRFDYFVQLCQAQFDKSVHTMIEMRDRQNKKLRGDLFELFCQNYLKHVYSTQQFCSVWLWSEIPQEVRDKLGIKTRDEGIDLVAIDSKGRYYAVQVKYRKYRPEKSKQFVGWKQLSTFYALAYRVGKFHKHIVMTNVDGVRHVTKKTSKDVSICKRRFQKMSYWDWKLMSENKEYSIPPKSQLTPQEVREKRLAFFSK